jgi:hypothetical protein
VTWYSEQTEQQQQQQQRGGGKKPEYHKNRLSKIHTLLKGVNELRIVLSIFLDRFGSNLAQDISN